MKKKEYIPWKMEFAYYNPDNILMISGQSSDFTPDYSYDGESWMEF